MSLSVSNLQQSLGNSDYHSTAFRNVLEDHLYYLRADGSVRMIDVSPHIQSKYRGDFYGMLTELDIRSHLHWITMRVNGFHSPLEWDKEDGYLLIPDENAMDGLLQRFQNSESLL